MRDKIYIPCGVICMGISLRIDHVKYRYNHTLLDKICIFHGRGIVQYCTTKSRKYVDFLSVLQYAPSDSSCVSQRFLLDKSRNGHLCIHPRLHTFVMWNQKGTQKKCLLLLFAGWASLAGE